MSDVSTQNPLYTDKIDDNKLIRDCIEGDKLVKAAGRTYVPSLSGQDETAYQAYLQRAVFSNYVNRTKEGLIGLAFAKSPIVTVPKALEALMIDATGTGLSFYDVAKEAVSEVISVGRCCYLEDAPANTEEIEGFSAKTTTIAYKTESVINWRYSKINGINTLILVVLEETEDDWTDEFTNEPQTIYRVLRLVDGKYEQNIYRYSGEDNKTESIEVIQPKMNGKALDKIPFFGITPTMATLNPAKSPLYDIAILNTSHFKLDVDLHHGLHFTALPTPYGSGIQMEKDKTINVGSTTFLTFNDPNAKLDFLEFEGTGLQAIVDKLEEKKQAMAIVGSRMLENSTKAKESAEAQSSRNNNERASLISTLDTVSKVLVQILEVKAEWNGITGEIKYDLNTDFDLAAMDSNSLKALTESWMSGAITREILFNNLKGGEIIGEDVVYEDYKTAIDDETPSLSVPPATSSSKSKESDSNILKNVAEYIGLGNKKEA